MSKKEQKLSTSEPEQQSVNVEIPEALLKQIRDEEEKKAFARVCKAAGTTPKEIEALESKPVVKEEMIAYDVTPIIVSINGEAQPSRGIAPRGKVEVILAAAGNMRNRRLEELIGKNFEIKMLRDGTMQSRVVGAQDAAGLEVKV